MPEDHRIARPMTNQQVEARGRAEGEARGRAEGEAKGRTEGKSEIAKRMIASGLDQDRISEFTGLSFSELKALR